MASLSVCAIDGTVENPAALPPNVQPCEFKTAVATYSLVICNECLKTKTIPDLILYAEQAGPGGTVEGDARIPYLVKE